MSRKNAPILLAPFLLASCFVLIFSVVHAQGVPTPFGIDLSVSSQNPLPGQQVTITARSYSVDINSSKITWSVGGKVVKSGTGATTYTLTAPTLGKRITVNVTAVTSDGVTINGNVSVSSGSVDMVVETDGFVPPSFKGKLPVVYQNSVKVVAMPHIANSSGVEYDPHTLVYKWKKNDTVLEDQSGYGKQSVTLVGEIVPRPYDLTVTATPRTGSGQAEGVITITPASPSITFYVDDPLYGPLYNSAITDTLRIGSQKEIPVLAVPYGFNKPENGIGDLTLSWTINGGQHPELSTSDSVILRAPEGSTGSSDISLDIRSNADILQGTNGSFSASFSGK